MKQITNYISYQLQTLLLLFIIPAYGQEQVLVEGNIEAITADLPAASIGNINADTIDISGTAQMGDLHVGNRMHVGSGGIHSTGDISTSGDLLINGQPVIPTGTITFFNLNTCPSGWTEFTQARGRFIVGSPNVGDVANTVGSPLSNKEVRSAGAHSHSVPMQVIQPPNVATLLHTHMYQDYYWSDSGSSGGVYETPTGDGVGIRDQDVRTTNSVQHAHTVHIPEHQTVSSGGNIPAPYIQLLLCIKG